MLSHYYFPTAEQLREAAQKFWLPRRRNAPTRSPGARDARHAYTHPRPSPPSPSSPVRLGRQTVHSDYHLIDATPKKPNTDSYAAARGPRGPMTPLPLTGAVSRVDMCVGYGEWI